MLAQRRCAAKTKQGKPCPFAPWSGGSGVFCMNHDPSLEAEAKRRNARQAGGRAKGKVKVLPPDAARLKLLTLADVLALVAETIGELRTGALDPKIASSVASLANVATRIIDLQANKSSHSAPITVVFHRPDLDPNAKGDDLVVTSR